METYACYSCGRAIAEDDYLFSKHCPMCDSPLGNPQRRYEVKLAEAASLNRETEEKK